MRWERLFEDLQGAAEELVRDERDALADDLHDELWAERSWAELLAGPVRLAVLGSGEVAGEVRGVSAQVLRLVSGAEEILVATEAVMAVLSSRQGQAPLAATGWGAVLRAARDDAEPVRLTRRDGQSCEGRVRAVARDAVVMQGPEGRELTIPWSAIALVRCPR